MSKEKILELPSDKNNSVTSLVEYLSSIIEPKGLKLTYFVRDDNAHHNSHYMRSIIMLHRGDESQTLSTCGSVEHVKSRQSTKDRGIGIYNVHRDKIMKIDFQNLDFDEYFEYSNLLKYRSDE
mgnify:FL=1